jgi:hypothetical protein
MFSLVGNQHVGDAVFDWVVAIAHGAMQLGSFEFELAMVDWTDEQVE